MKIVDENCFDKLQFRGTQFATVVINAPIKLYRCRIIRILQYFNIEYINLRSFGGKLFMIL